MFTQTIADSPQNRRGGQVSYLLLAPGQFGSANLAITCVEAEPGGYNTRSHPSPHPGDNPLRYPPPLPHQPSRGNR
jgi:hypothetical protein